MTTYVDAACLCELNAFRVAFDADADALPVATALCHCSICRHVSGQMFSEYVATRGPPLQRSCDAPSVHSSLSHNRTPVSRSEPRGGIPLEYASHHGTSFTSQNMREAAQGIPAIVVQEPEEPYDLSRFTAYSTGDKLRRYFCSYCSAHLLVALVGEDGKETWMVSASVLAGVTGVVKRVYHQWVGATLDGGIADSLRTINGLTLPRYEEGVGSQVLPLPWHAEGYVKADRKDDAPASDRLHARCRCGGVQFALTRPTSASAEPCVPFPDLLVRHDGARLPEIYSTHDEKWWLFPHTRPHDWTAPPATRYLAGHCMCSICRFASGAELVSWAYVPAVNVVDVVTGAPLDLGEKSGRPKALHQYIVSPGEFWEFCEVCGATVFSWRLVHADIVQVAVGVLNEEKGGVRQEGWLEWHKERVSYQEKAVDPALAESLVEGLKV